MLSDIFCESLLFEVVWSVLTKTRVMCAVFSATVVWYSTSSPVMAANGGMRLLSGYDLNPKRTTCSAAIQSVFEDINVALRVR